MKYFSLDLTHLIRKEIMMNNNARMTNTVSFFRNENTTFYQGEFADESNFFV